MMSLVRPVASLLTIGILVSGCAGISQPAQDKATGLPQTVRVGVSDQGQTVSLQVGQRLAVSLPKIRQGSDLRHLPGSWILVHYPRALNLVSGRASSEGRFELIASRTGRGRLVAIAPRRCGGPVPLARQRKACPVAADARAATPPPVPTSFVVTAVVRTGKV